MQREFFESMDESWDVLKRSGLPVCIYGTGNACERLLEQFERRGIKCADIFASDDFVRGQCFHGFKVLTLSQVEQRHGDFLVCTAFGSDLESVMSRICEIAKRHRVIYPDLPVAGDEFFSKERFLERFSNVKSVYDVLADEQSKRVFKGVFSFKITGDVSWLLPTFTDSDDDFSSLIRTGDGEVFVDLGAYSGDTAEKFITHTHGNYEHIYAFEPDKRSFRKCVKRLIGYDNLSLINACAWQCDDIIGFSQSAGRQSKISANGSCVSARSVDSVLGEKKCTVIKYDVEGAEREAIIGSGKTIRRYSPRLAVSAYHRPYDILDLPKQILSINPDYRVYLRQPPYFPAWDTLIYFI